MLNISFSFSEFTAMQKRKEDAKGDGLYDGGEEGKARNAVPPNRPNTVLAVCIAMTCSYMFWEEHIRVRCQAMA